MTKFDSVFVVVVFLFSFFQHVPRVCHAESDNDEVPKDKAIKDKIKKSKSHRGHPLDGDMGYWDCEASSFEERKGTPVTRPCIFSALLVYSYPPFQTATTESWTLWTTGTRRTWTC